MRRSLILAICLLISMLGAQPVAAQSYPNLPSRIVVSSSARTLRVGQLAEIRIALLDEQGQGIAASQGTPINLVCTKFKDLSSAKNNASENIALVNGVLELPQGTVSTVKTSFAIPRGESDATLRFRSQQAGAIRIFAESEKLVTGSTLIAVVGGPSHAAHASAFRTISYQEEATPAYALSIEKGGTEKPILNEKREWVYNLNVLLTSGETPVEATEPIKVYLKIESGTATPSTNPITIPRGEAGSDVIELRSSVGGEVKISARATLGGQFPISPAQATFEFPEARRATKLLLDALPPAAMANGLEAIQLRVRAVDEANNPIRAEDEGLPARDVIFRLEGKAFGIKFDKGVTKVTIPKNEMAAAINIFGSSPIDGTNVIAESENGLGIAINGTTKVQFSFPWWQLGLAILGGALVPPLRRVMLPSRRRTHRRQLHSIMLMLADLAKRGLVGVLVGGLFFVVFFFGAAIMDGFNWNGITINLTRLPLQNGVAAFAIGIFGSLLIDMRTFFKASITNMVGKLKAARAGVPSA